MRIEKRKRDKDMRSDSVKTGTAQAPHRSLFNALGFTEEERRRPMIGIVSSFNEIVPGHMNLDKIADAVKAGVEMAGGTPILIPAIGVCDGIAMGHVGMKYSLASRELICDSVETMLMAHQLDGLVLVPNCDKIVPGMVMAAVRMDVPAVVCSGGPMLAGSYGGEEVSLSKMFEAVGAYKAGMITDEQLEDCTCNCCPSCGSCSGMYTANSMNCLCEAIGIALPGNGTIPAVYSKRLQLAKHAGMAIMDMVNKGITARQIINERSIRNALTCDMALGCSTNTMLHLPAIAREAGVELNLEIANEISAKTPNLCHLAPAGPTYMEDLNEAGGVYAVMNELKSAGLLNEEIVDMDSKSVSDTISRGGTILQTARCKEFVTAEGQQKGAEICKKHGIDAIVVIGGDGSFQGAQKLAALGINTIGLPGTIDLDIACTDYTIGFDTAVNTAMEAIDKVRDTSTSHERCSVIEVMGRDAGYLALWCGIANGAEKILMPEEKDYDEKALIKDILENKKRGKKNYIIINAEGVGDSINMAKRIEDATGIETRATILGHMQRGGSPTCKDRVYASTMGAIAVDLLCKGKTNRVVGYKNGQFIDFDIEEALAMKKTIPAYQYDVAKTLAL